MFGKELGHHIGANKSVPNIVVGAFSHSDELECWEGVDLEFNDGLDEVCDTLDGILHTIKFHILILSDICILSEEVANALIGFIQSIHLFSDRVAALHNLIAVNSIHHF